MEQNGSLLDQVLADYTVGPDNSVLTELLNMPAREIMAPEVIWCDPETTVQEVIGLMQQHSVGYVLVGRDGVLEGLLSNSSIQSAISPYLRPAFAKWRRPEDDATLGIKVKWVMSRPVRTVKPETSLATIIESMCRYGGRCLPVVDAQSKVQGIITVFDILLRVLEADQSLSWKGKPPQAVPVLV
jgi:CBS domain-containing protein